MEKFEKFGFTFEDQDGSRLSDSFGLPKDRFDLIDRLTAKMRVDGNSKSDVFLKILNALEPQSINEIVATAYFLGREHGFHRD